ncbi:hypothetical protein HYU06_05770, partial [Candidatus Woesearchaeota archaeon]|nr:hypothetical protein [Candidatus Woesearchaeota archaeon]
ISKIFNVRHNLKHSKKASLSLSINAIVVLVLAISMLGLGLAFTKSMFKKFGEKLTVPPPDLPATKDDPIVLPSEELVIRHGEEFTFQVNYFNDYASGTVDAGLICKGSLGGPVGIGTKNILSGGKVLVSPQKVSGGIQKSFKFIIPKAATSGISQGTDVCEIMFCAPGADDTEGILEIVNNEPTCTSEGSTGGETNDDSKQITIKIT